MPWKKINIDQRASKVQKKKGFAKIDANNDGVISEEEFNASINTDEL